MRAERIPPALYFKQGAIDSTSTTGIYKGFKDKEDYDFHEFIREISRPLSRIVHINDYVPFTKKFMRAISHEEKIQAVHYTNFIGLQNIIQTQNRNKFTVSASTEVEPGLLRAAGGIGVPWARYICFLEGSSGVDTSYDQYSMKTPDGIRWVSVDHVYGNLPYKETRDVLEFLDGIKTKIFSEITKIFQRIDPSRKIVASYDPYYISDIFNGVPERKATYGNLIFYGKYEELKKEITKLHQFVLDLYDKNIDMFIELERFRQVHNITNNTRGSKKVKLDEILLSDFKVVKVIILTLGGGYLTKTSTFEEIAEVSRSSILLKQYGIPFYVLSDKDQTVISKELEIMRNENIKRGYGSLQS